MAVCALALGLMAPTEGPHLRWFSGEVEVGSGDPPVWSPAHVGDRLEPGEAIRTARGARAEIALGNRTVRLYENSLLRLPPDLGSSGSVGAVEMEEGSSLFDVRRSGSDDQFEVRTPEVVVIVKGTQFSVALEDAAAAVAVFRGTVGLREFGGSGDHEVLVRAGFLATGGTSQPFELSVLPEMEVWEAWDRHEAVPPALRPRRERPKSAAVESETRSLALRALEPEVMARAAERTPEITWNLEPDTDVPAAPSPRDDVEDVRRRTGRSDHEQIEAEIVEAFTEAMLNGGVAGGGTGLTIDYQTSGGPNRVIVSGSTFSQTLYKDDVEQMLATADFSMLDTGIVSALAAGGFAVEAFVMGLDELF